MLSCLVCQPIEHACTHVTACHCGRLYRHIMELNALGDDVCSSICARLDVKSLAAMAQTSRRYAALINGQDCQSRIWEGA